MDLLEVLAKEKEQITSQFDKNTQNKIDNVISDLNSLLTDINQLPNFDVTRLVPFIDEQTVHKIKYFQTLLTLQYFKINQDELKSIEDLLNLIINQMADKKEGISKNNILIEEKIKLLDELVFKINDPNSILSVAEIKSLVEILKKYYSDIEINNILVQLCNKSIANIGKNKIETEEELEIVIETNIDEKALKELLSKYNYNIDSFKKADVELLLRYGNLENITKILDLLKDNNIFIVTKKYGTQFCQILIHSNEKILNDIINNIKADFTITTPYNITLNELFNQHLKLPSLFIEKTRAYKKRSPRKINEPPGIDNPGPKETPTDYIRGSYSNYMANRELFMSLGADISKIIYETGNILTLPNQQIKGNIAVFDYYQIPPKVYLSTLSCFYATDPFEAIDQFIELGCYEYILNNFSRVNLKANDQIFYRIKEAKKQNVPVYRSFISDSLQIQLTGTISNNKQKGFGIDSINGSEIVNQYNPQFPLMYDELIKDIVFDGDISLAQENFFIKKLDENFMVSALKYDFNGVTISRYKVLRYYEMLIRRAQGGTIKALMYAICKNSILTEEEFKRIENSVNKIFNRGVAR